MKQRQISHPVLMFLILIAHSAMLLLVILTLGFSPEVVKLSCAVLAADFVGSIILSLVHRQACTVDMVLLLVLGMSTIYQSCFGGVDFNLKHYIFGIAAFAACQLSYLMVRNPFRAEQRKPLWYAMFFLLAAAIFFLTGSRGIWIDLKYKVNNFLHMTRIEIVLHWIIVRGSSYYDIVSSSIGRTGI